MPKLGLGSLLSQIKSAFGFTPKKLPGLSLWLKADAGITKNPTYISQITVSNFTGAYIALNGTYNYIAEEDYWFHSSAPYYINQSGSLIDDNDGTVIATNSNNFQGAWTPTNYFSTITLSNAGEDADQGIVVVNGTYTRSDANLPNGPFFASGGRSISFDDNEGEFWTTNGDYYRNYANLAVNGWGTENGEEPVPTAVNSNSPRNIGSPTSTVTYIDNSVTAWADQSGNARNAVEEEDDGKKSLVSIGGESFVGFNNTSMLVPLIFEPDSTFVGTIFAVARFDSSSIQSFGSRIFCINADEGLFQLTRGRNNTNNFYLSLDDNTFVLSNQTTNNNTNYIVGTSFNSSSASLFLNGAPAGTGSFGQNSSLDASVILGLGEPHKLAEIIVYNRVLTALERRKVDEYLANKYSIPIPSFQLFMEIP
jgi:hypothetical protein